MEFPRNLSRLRSPWSQGQKLQRVPGSINAFPTSIGSLVLPLPSTRSPSKQIHHEVRVGLFIFWKRASRGQSAQLLANPHAHCRQAVVPSALHLAWRWMLQRCPFLSQCFDRVNNNASNRSPSWLDRASSRSWTWTCSCRGTEKQK